MFRRITVLVVLFLAHSGIARAYHASPEWCGYVEHTPEVVFQEIQTSLNHLGVAMVPSQTFAKEPFAPAWTLLREGNIVGRAYFRKSLGLNYLTVLDAELEPIFTLQEETKLCRRADPQGLCKTISLTPLLEKAKESIPPFQLVRDREYGYRFLRYGKIIPTIVWRGEFRDAVKRLIRYTAETELTTEFKPESPAEAVVAILAAEPTVALYLSSLKIVREGQVIHIFGRLPHAVYNKLVLHSIEQGLRISPHITIDSGLPILPLESERLHACVRF